MSDHTENLSVTLFGEILTVDQLARNRVAKVMPKGMELSHFTVLNHLANTAQEKTPAQLAKAFNLTRGAMTNTLGKLEWAGYIHVRPDWDDARRKRVSISPSGRAARDAAMAAIGPLINQVADDLGDEKLRQILPILRELRLKLLDDS